MKSSDIISLLPYDEPFLFVDRIISVSENRVEGAYEFNADAFYYKGHFKENPITPGVILTECMAQIGLVSLGIYLLAAANSSGKPGVAMTSTQIDFLKPVLPGEKVTVIGLKEYFRFNKLKCSVKMLNANLEIVSKGSISGMMIPGKQS